MQERNFEAAVDYILDNDVRYPRDAYVFMRDALDQTVKALAAGERENPRNVSIVELLGGIRDYALGQFGPMTITVLEEWGIRETSHFGDLVFNLIEAGWLAKTEQDRRSDFDRGFDFEEAFRKPFLPSRRAASGPGAVKAVTV